MKVALPKNIGEFSGVGLRADWCFQSDVVGMVNARSGIHSFDAEQEGDLAITEVHTDAIVVTERILFMLNTPRR